MHENFRSVYLEMNSARFVQEFEVDREERVAFLQQVSQHSLHGGILFLSHQAFVNFEFFLELRDEFL